MHKKINFFSITICLISFFIFFFIFTKNRTIFLRDDYDVLTAVMNFKPAQIFVSQNEHFIPFLRILYLIEFKLFNMYFHKYLILQILIHLTTSLILYSIINTLTNNKFLSLLGLAIFAATAGVSYKIFVIIISQIWLFEALFSSASLLFTIKYIKAGKIVDYYLSLVMAFFTFCVSPIGIGLFLVIFILKHIYSKNKKGKLYIPLICAIISSAVYVNFTYNVSFKAIQNNLNFLYPIYVFRFIFFGFIWGTVIQLFFPWFNFLRPLPQSVLLRLGIVFIFLFTLVMIVLLLKRNWQKFKKEKLVFLILTLYVFFHFSIIGLGRTANLGYTLSPQYTYFPRLIIITGLIYTLGRILKPKLYYVLFLAFYLVTTQVFYYLVQLNKWQYRYNYTKNYISDLGYIFGKNIPVLNLYCPDSISPVIKYSQMASLYFPEKKVDFIEKGSVDLNKYLSSNVSDERVYRFYQNAINGFDIKHY